MSRTLSMCRQGSPIRFAEEHVHEDGVAVMRSPDDFISKVSSGFLDILCLDSI